MTSGEKPLIARAMVNRTWAHFMGCGFTNPVDDMGPPSAVAPRIARSAVGGIRQERLRREGTDPLDLRQRGVSAHQQHHDQKRQRRSGAGHTPLFSRVYPKPLEAEQLYDSLLIATDAEHAVQADWSERQKQRDEWLQQFIIAFGTDENDEANTFNGTIPQALLMMNGQLIQKAISARRQLSAQVLESEKTIRRRSTGSTWPRCRGIRAATKWRRPSTWLSGSREVAGLPRPVLGTAQLERIHHQPLAINVRFRLSGVTPCKSTFPPA